MSKNTLSSAHRKVDVDLYDADRFVDDELAETSADNASAVSSKETEVRGMLNKGDNKGALVRALADPPLRAKDQAVKDKAHKVVMDVLMAFKTTDIEGAVKTLSEQDVDTLMKYVYRGMAQPDDGNSAQLLQWHQKTASVGGVGSIIRVMTERHTV